MNLTSLVTEIKSIDSSLVKRATSAVNIALTARNWIVGAYIVEFEQNGEDRAKYGQKLIPELAKQLVKLKIRGLTATMLRYCRTFYLSYPSIHQIVSGEFPELLNNKSLQIRQTLSGEFKNKQKKNQY